MGFAPALADAALTAAAQREGMAIEAIVETAASVPPPAGMRRLRRVVEVVLRRLFDPPEQRRSRRRGSLGGLPGVARRHGVPLVVPPQRDINHPELTAWLSNGRGDAVALSLGCLQHFRKPLLDACAVTVNYHDGSLPAYRGLRATAWSVYRGETRSGFTFHHMDEGLDSGPILLQEDLPVTPGAPPYELVRAKTARARAVMGEVLRAIRARSPGRPQQGEAKYFGRRELVQVTSIPDPSALGWAELTARLGAFDRLTMTLANREWPVTAIRRVTARGGGRLAFVTRDGVRAEPLRVLHLPIPLYRLMRRVAPAAARGAAP